MHPAEDLGRLISESLNGVGLVAFPHAAPPGYAPDWIQIAALLGKLESTLQIVLDRSDVHTTMPLHSLLPILPDLRRELAILSNTGAATPILLDLAHRFLEIFGVDRDPTTIDAA